MLPSAAHSRLSDLRAGLLLAGFLALTLPLMPLQAAFVRFSPRAARAFPHWYHRQVCRLLGIRVHIDGDIVRDRPLLIVANHTSWLDIPVLSSVAPVSFVAKREVGSWPFVSWLAKLQRTVFVDRTRKSAVGTATNQMASRLGASDALLLFAEGTSTDGNRVLPFMSSLFGATEPGQPAAREKAIHVQTLALVYTHLHGIPFGRADRPLVGWYGDMAMGGHAWRLLGAGPLDVHIRIGPPAPIDEFADRKSMARRCECEVRESVVRILRARPQGAVVDVTDGAVSGPKGQRRMPAASSRTWT